MYFNRLVQEISIRFLEAWDERDFVRLESLLASDIVFSSPNVADILPEHADGKVYGTVATIAYLKELAKVAPDFRFDRDKSLFNKEDRTIVMRGVMSQNGKTLIATYLLNEYGKFSSISISYPQGFV